jgi:hypothetical protein
MIDTALAPYVLLAFRRRPGPGAVDGMVLLILVWFSVLQREPKLDSMPEGEAGNTAVSL